jgi:hypothetical protein
VERIHEAFSQAERVHRWISREANNGDDSDYQYLSLHCLGAFPGHDGARWAASFDFNDDDPEWYEKARIGSYPTGTRAPTPEGAILGAVEKLLKIIGADLDAVPPETERE